MILILVFLAAQAVFGVVALFLTGSGGKINSLVVALMEALSLAALIPVIRARLGRWLTDYVRYSPVSVREWAGTLVCCVGLVLSLSQVEALVVRAIPISHFWRTVFGQLTGADAFARGLLLAAVAAPIVEEIIFRGVILRGFVVRYGASRALLYSSLLFAVVHLNPWQFLPAIALGFFLGALYLRTGTVVATWAAHAFYNGSLMTLSRFAPTRFIVDAEASADTSAARFAVLTVTGAVIFFLGFLLLMRAPRRPVPPV